VSVYVSEGPAPSLKCHRFVPTFRPLPILKDSHSSIERVRLNRREDHPHAQPQRNTVTGHNSYPSLNLYLTEQRHPPTTLTLPKPNGLHPPKPPVPLFIPQHSTPPYSICTLLNPSPTLPTEGNQPTNQPNRAKPSPKPPTATAPTAPRSYPTGSDNPTHQSRTRRPRSRRPACGRRRRRSGFSQRGQLLRLRGRGWSRWCGCRRR